MLHHRSTREGMAHLLVQESDRARSFSFRFAQVSRRWYLWDSCGQCRVAYATRAEGNGHQAWLSASPVGIRLG